MNKDYIAIGVMAACVVAAIGYAFSVTGSPFAARDARLDEIRIQHLSAIRTAIQNYSAVNGRLPASFDELPETNYGYSKKMKDPVTDESYEYIVKGGGSYELCAEFATEGKAEKKVTSYSYFGLEGQSDFVHEKGRDCWADQVQIYGPAQGAESPEASIQAADRDAVRISDLFTVRVALELYYEKYKAYPKNITSWSALQQVIQAENTLSGWPQDPTGTYYYALNKDKTSYVLGALLEKEMPTGPQYTGGTQGGMEFPRRCGQMNNDGTGLFCISGS